MIQLPAAPPRMTVAEINRVTGLIIGGSMRVHSQLGAGLLENVYLVCLAHELGNMAWPSSRT